MTTGENATLFNVVINGEEQFSIWPAYRAVPEGWKKIGPEDAPKQECLDYIDKTWTDMRPLSLRTQS
ncbi:MAG: MbtH family NRPS accessory protein [Pseudomonadota bacterium]